MTWAQEQIARVQGPVYARKRAKERVVRRRARFDGHTEYAAVRRLQRLEAKALCFRIKMGWES